MCQPSRTNSVYDLFESVYWSPDAITASIRNALYGAACYETRDEDTITVASDTLQPDDYIIKDLPMHDVPEIIVVPVMPAMPSHLHRPQQLIPLKANKSEKKSRSAKDYVTIALLIVICLLLAYIVACGSNGTPIKNVDVQ